VRENDKVPVFLDRDGTIIVEREYLSDPDQVSLEVDVAEGLALLQRERHPLIVVSNQSGIARGKLTVADAERVNAKTDELLCGLGIKIRAWFICPHAPDAGCACRKPLPGMALEAAQTLGIDIAGGYVIGDKCSDVELADAIGGVGILLTTGHGRRFQGWAEQHSRPVFGSLLDAARYISVRDSRGVRN
jgi:D-glycero-D-manno-heptose 1,7-bisphosphate phosphatase